MSLSLPRMQAIALNRFGLGARPNETLSGDPKGWLLGQLARFDAKPAAYAGLSVPGARVRAILAQDHPPAAGTSDAIPLQTDLVSILRAKRPDQQQAMAQEAHDGYAAAINARVAIALDTEAPFVERLAAFWSNHFALSIEKPQVGIFAAAYEIDAIRPHVLGRFEDMLMAVEHHPAMLFYLDQYGSVGPGSWFSQQVVRTQPGMDVGLNENLAREIMELHTLGARSGYSQADVTEFARALTGWTVSGMGYRPASDEPTTGSFVFRDVIHSPGNRTIMGKVYPAGGEQQAKSVLHDLANAPATARHISTKLARHFVADNPPPAMIERMSKAFLESQGDLPAVYRVMIEAPEAWAATATKFKTPWDWVVSMLRGLGRREVPGLDFQSMLTLLGQSIWQPGSPAGFDDISASWAAPEALVVRVQLAEHFASQAARLLDARTLAPKLMPGMVSPTTAAAIAQAESGASALTLMLVSPEFQRR
ncbi:DUF1800 family protein [Sphingomonas sp. MMS24-J13]|uniref:DUF1800 domain-containing protein n=1 Tax=Sphingomonas sp. MMS24-J13 TaxID=3238686 RepID=UPI00384A5CB3